MVQLTNDPFLNELNKMYERNKDKGTVWVTMKRSAIMTQPAPPPPPRAHRCSIDRREACDLRPCKRARMAPGQAFVLPRRHAPEQEITAAGPGVHFAAAIGFQL